MSSARPETRRFRASAAAMPGNAMSNDPGRTTALLCAAELVSAARLLLRRIAAPLALANYGRSSGKFEAGR